MFPNGQDGYHFNIKMINTEIGEYTGKKVSSTNFYSYQIIVGDNEYNNILKCCQLFNQYIDDMYAKTQSERLLFIRLNQKI